MTTTAPTEQPVLLVLTNRNRESLKEVEPDYVFGPFDTEAQAMDHYRDIAYLIPDPGPWWLPSTHRAVALTPAAFRAALVADHEPDELTLPEGERYIPALKPEHQPEKGIAP